MFRRSRKRLIRYGLLSANLALLLAVIGFVIQSPSPGQEGVRNNAIANASSSAATNPLDEPSSADIAVHLARMASLPESTAVVNQADTVSAQLAITSTETVIAKPQVVATALKSRKDIQSYVTQNGDTLASLATKFGVTSDSIKWSNNLTNTNLAAGTTLSIPPVNGIIYKVKAGDTAEKLAREYNANKDNIITFNDAEVKGLSVNELIVIPDGTKAAPMYVATASYSGGSSFAWGGSSAIYGYNGYEYGWCTWYVASKISVPANWGNANTWARYAGASGWTVSKMPRVGAVAQNSGPGLGHVAVVEAVSEDGAMIKYSDMNGLAGWGRAGYSGWVPVSKFQNYIYR